jgi:hypothetical protein
MKYKSAEIDFEHLFPSVYWWWAYTIFSFSCAYFSTVLWPFSPVIEAPAKDILWLCWRIFYLTYLNLIAVALIVWSFSYFPPLFDLLSFLPLLFHICHIY